MILLLLILCMLIILKLLFNHPQKPENHFVFIIDGIPSWKCFSSICIQKYQNFRILVINHDNKFGKLIELINYWSVHEKIKIDNCDQIKNSEILCFLAKDDWLLNPNVLDYLNNVYDNGTDGTYCNSYYINTNNTASIVKNGVFPLFSGRRFLFNKDLSQDIVKNILTNKNNIKVFYNPFYVKNTEMYEPKKSIVQGKNSNIFDEIFLINLEGRYDRKLFMKFKMQNFNLQYTIWYAEDGYLPKNKAKFERYLQYQRTPLINSSGAYGLLLTYKSLLEYCLEKKYKRILILEDDIYFIQNFLEKLNKARDIFDKYNIVYLGGNQEYFTEEQNTLGYYKVSDKIPTYGTYAICLNDAIIKLILQKLQDIDNTNQTIDYLIWNLQKETSMGSVLNPNLIVPELRESDNMGPRDLVEYSKIRRWDLSLYEHINLYESFIYSYRQVYNKNYNIRQDESFTLPTLTYELSKSLIEGENNSFLIIIPSYNNEKWYEKNLMSVFNQNYPLWRIIYVNDCSTDSTSKLVKEFVAKNNMEKKVQVIDNEKQMYQAYSRHRAYMLANKDEICCFLDGDDFLFDEHVLLHLNRLYRNGYNCTYGRFTVYEDGKFTQPFGTEEFPKEVVQNKSYRKYPWISQHLRTCRANLIQNIPIEHIKDFNGNWLRYCTDLAEMFWILENSNGKHTNSNKLLYIYNKENSQNYPNSFYRLENQEYKQKVEEFIRNR